MPSTTWDSCFVFLGCCWPTAGQALEHHWFYFAFPETICDATPISNQHWSDASCIPRIMLAHTRHLIHRTILKVGIKPIHFIVASCTPRLMLAHCLRRYSNLKPAYLSDASYPPRLMSVTLPQSTCFSYCGQPTVRDDVLESQ